MIWLRFYPEDTRFSHFCWPVTIQVQLIYGPFVKTDLAFQKKNKK